MKKISAVLLVTGFLGTATPEAYAIDRAGREVSYAERVSILRSIAGNAVVTGYLVCRHSEKNNGSACDMRLREKGTGVEYALENNKDLHRMYHDGVRKVAVTGRRSGKDSFTVTKVEAL